MYDTCVPTSVCVCHARAHGGHRCQQHTRCADRCVALGKRGRCLDSERVSGLQYIQATRGCRVGTFQLATMHCLDAVLGAGAIVVWTGGQGNRRIRASEFHLPPGRVGSAGRCCSLCCHGIGVRALTPVPVRSCCSSSSFSGRSSGWARTPAHPDGPPPASHRCRYCKLYCRQTQPHTVAVDVVRCACARVISGCASPWASVRNTHTVTHAHTHTHTHTHRHTRTQLHTHAHTHTHIYIHTYIHTYTHTDLALRRRHRRPDRHTPASPPRCTECVKPTRQHGRGCLPPPAGPNVSASTWYAARRSRVASVVRVRGLPACLARVMSPRRNVVPSIPRSQIPAARSRRPRA
jgi:hypothetical protein